MVLGVCHHVTSLLAPAISKKELNLLLVPFLLSFCTFCRWVTAAKSLVFGKCAIDMLAGPSECLVIADDSASPATIAADLLAQAEHDTAAVPILVTTSQSIIDSVNKCLEEQLAILPTAGTARASTANVCLSKYFCLLAQFASVLCCNCRVLLCYVMIWIHVSMFPTSLPQST